MKDNSLHEGKDEEFDALVLDDDKTHEFLEGLIIETKNSGNVIDFHSPGIFDDDWFDLVIILKCSTEILFDRLTERGYNKKKLNENMECEIMQVVLEDARECFDENIIQNLDSNNVADMESNLNRIEQWYELWKQQNRNDEVESTVKSDNEKKKRKKQKKA